MNVKVGDLYEYTGETGFDLVQNNTYPIINIGKNKDITILEHVVGATYNGYEGILHQQHYLE